MIQMNFVGSFWYKIALDIIPSDVCDQFCDGGAVIQLLF
jgi:hypothetical protein